MSMTEAEYVGAFNATKEALWFGRVASTFRQREINQIPTVYKESQGIVALMKNTVYHFASKYIQASYHCVRDCMTWKKPSPKKIFMTDIVANTMTRVSQQSGSAHYGYGWASS